MARRRPIRDFFAKRLQNLILTPRVLPDSAPEAYDVLSGEAGDYQAQQAATLAPVLGGIHLIARTASASSWTVERYIASNQSWVPVPRAGWPDWAKPDKGPHPTQTLPVAIETWILSRLIGSNSYIIPTITLGSEVREWFCPPGAYVYAYETGSYRNPVQYTYSGKIFKQASSRKVVRLDEILHTPTLLINSQMIGTSAFAKAAPSFRAGIKADAHAEYVHESGGMQQSILTVSERWGKSQQFDEFADKIGTRLKNPKHRGAPIVAPGDLRAVSLHATPQDSQLIDARSLTWSAASAILTLPPTLAGAPNVTTWGSGTRAQMDLFRAFTLSGHIAALNDTFSRLLPMNWRFRLTPEHLQWQADPLGAARYTTRLAGKIMTQNEARAVVGLPPVDDERADELTFEPDATGINRRDDSDAGLDDGNTNEKTTEPMEDSNDNSNDDNDEMEQEAMILKTTFTSEANSVTAIEQDTEAEDKQMEISGTAITYGELGMPTSMAGSQVPMVVKAGALDGTDLSDVFLLVQHSPMQTIARGSTGDVVVTVGDTDVKWKARLDMEDPDAVSVYRKVKRGTFKSCSMGFRVSEYEAMKHKDTGEDTWVVSKLDLHEISVVPDGAFPGSDSNTAEKPVFSAEQIEELFVPIVDESVEAEASQETTEALATVDKQEKTQNAFEVKDILYPNERNII